jgi:hypothetical protein
VSRHPTVENKVRRNLYSGRLNIIVRAKQNGAEYEICIM